VRERTGGNVARSGRGWEVCVCVRERERERKAKQGKECGDEY